MPYFVEFLVVYEIHVLRYVLVIASLLTPYVRNDTLLDKVADLDIPDSVHNWLVSYHTYTSHRHIDAQTDSF